MVILFDIILKHIMIIVKKDTEMKTNEPLIGGKSSITISRINQKKSSDIEFVFSRQERNTSRITIEKISNIHEEDTVSQTLIPQDPDKSSDKRLEKDTSKFVNPNLIITNDELSLESEYEYQSNENNDTFVITHQSGKFCSRLKTKNQY